MAPDQKTNISQALQRLWRVVVQSIKDFMTDDGPQWAAAIAYYSLLSTFPLMLAIASIAAFFVDPQWAVEQATNLLSRFIPQGTFQIEDTIRTAIEARGSVSILSILALLWSGSRVFGVVTKAMNIAFDVEDSYSFLKRTLVEVVMMVTLGILFVLALASRVLIGLLWETIQFLPGNGWLFTLIQSGFSAFLLIVVFFLIYRFVPRTKVDWRAALTGGIIATALFLVARPLFITYLNRFANYNLIYGSLAIVVILVFWAWIVSVIFLVCGELVSHIQQILIEGKPVEEVDYRHKMRSPTHKAQAEQQVAPAGPLRGVSSGEAQVVHSTLAQEHARQRRLPPPEWSPAVARSFKAFVGLVSAALLAVIGLWVMPKD